MLSELDNNGDRKVSFGEFVDNMALICSAVFSLTGDAQDAPWRWRWGGYGDGPNMDMTFGDRG